MSIKLVVSGLGHIPSFKNNKRAILYNRTGKMRTLTEPKVKKWMERCINSFAFQLSLEALTIDSAILTAKSPHCLIASLLPENDSCKFIVELNVTFQRVQKGSEGADLLIESTMKQP